MAIYQIRYSINMAIYQIRYY